MRVKPSGSIVLCCLMLLLLATDARAQFGQATVDELIAALPEAGSERARDPVDGRWKEHPASVELLQRIVRRKLTDEQWIEAIERTRVFELHERWPRGRTLAISLHAPMWLGPRGWVRVTPELPGARSAEARVIMPGCALANDWLRMERAYLEVGPPPGKSGEVRFHIEVFRGSRRDWEGEIVRPIEIVASESEAMRGVDDGAFDRAVEDALHVSIGKNWGKPRRTALWVGVQRTAEIEPFLQLHAFRPRVQILDGDTVIDEFIMRSEPEFAPPAASSYYRPSIDVALLEDPERVKHLRIRISGTAPGSFANLRRDSYWAGSIERPVGEMRRKGR